MSTTLLSPSNAKNKSAAYLWKMVFLTAITLLSASVKAQVASNYTFSEMANTPAYAALAVGTKTQIHTGVWNDGAAVNTAIGFTFTYNTVGYTTIYVSPNGFITFGATPTTTNYTPISSAEAYAGAIAGYGANLQVTAAAGTPQVNSVSKFLDVSGGVGNYILKVEYNSFRKAATETTLMSFQIWLYQATGVIEIHYNSNAAFAVNSTGQVGLRGSVNTDYNNRSWLTGNWPTLATTTTAGTANTDNIRTRNGTTIPAGSNRTFRWSPVSCFTPSGLAVTAGSVTATNAQLTWTAPTPTPAGYQYEVRTSGAAGSGATGLAQSGTSTTSPLNLTGLAGATTYCVYIRSDCGGTYSAWTSSACFTTLCAAQNIPYLNYFDPLEPGYTYTVPAIPPCSSIQNVGLGNVWVTENFSSPDGFYDEHLVYNQSGTQNANVWYYTQGVNLVAGSTYRLSYIYGGSTDFPDLTNKLMVAYGTAPIAGSMTLPLADHPNIKNSPLESIVNFTAPSTGVYYFGFKAYSNLANGKLFLDDIQIVDAICIKPTVSPASAITYSSAMMTWAAPSPAPANGYAYYISTSATPPDNNTTPTGYTSTGTTLVNLSGLNGSTTYYFWVRGNCGSGDFSEWSTVQSFTTLTTPPYCIPSNASSGSYINNLTTTAALTNVNNSSAYTTPGHADYTSLTVTQIQGGLVNFSIGLSGNGLGVGVAIWVDWDGNGTFSTAERMYDSAGFIYTASVSGSFTVPAGAPLGVTRMRVMCDYWATSPSPCAFGTTGTTRGEIEDYSFKVVVPPPPLTININSSTQCAGTNSPTISLTSALGNFDSYSWLPLTGVTGSAATGYVINSNSTITYTLTGTQTSGSFSTNTVTFTYNANPLPTPITITATPTVPTTCQNGPAVQLTAAGGVISGVPVLAENFETGAPTWTTTNTGSGGAVADASWTIRPDGFVPLGNTWGAFDDIHSNDSSQFYFTDSDDQGLGTSTNVTLVSPVFSLAGYTSASLSFWHYYKSWTNGGVYVELSTDGGGTWPITLQSYTSASQGALDNFANVITNLNPYTGMTNLRIRFRFTANWGWGWAVDNFVVSGSASSAITWTPITGLYTNAAATVPYVLGAGTNTVYALPSTTTVYTASASTPSPTVCTTSTTASVTITPIVGGTLSSNQSVCNGVISNITLSGQSGTITTWQSATNAGFTAGLTNIPGSAGATTLTAAMLGNVNVDTYIRVQMTNGSCTAYSTSVLITVPSATWNGTAWVGGTPNATTRLIFAGNYSSTGNLSGCSVQINSGNVVFNSGHSLIVQNGVTRTGGTLTFENNASLVQVNDNAVNSGYIVYKRNTTGMVRYDYTYWSSPLYPQTLVGVSPLTRYDKYFRFDTATDTYIPVPGNTLMDPGKGYIIRAPEGWPLTSTIYSSIMDGGDATPPDGVPNNGIVTVPIVDAGGINNMNLIGNPYPSAIDAHVFLDANPSVGGTLYFWTHNTEITANDYTASDYALYNYLGSNVGSGTAGGGVGNSNVPTRYVASGQGFFIEGLVNGTATFNNSMRVAGSNSNFYRVGNGHNATPEAPEMSRVWLKIATAQGLSKQTLVGYTATATNEMDRGYDGETLDGGGQINLFSLVGTTKLGIQGRALPFDINDQVPIGYRADAAGTYTISLADKDGIFVGDAVNIYLEDKLLNVIHNIKESAYSFATATGAFEDRFVLRYTESALGTGNPVFTENTVLVYKQDHSIYVNTSNIDMAEVKVFDMRGRLIYERKGINSNETVISNLNASQQVLIVTVTSTDNRTVSKKIIF